MKPWVKEMFFGGYNGHDAGRNGTNVVEIGQHLMQNRFPEIAEVDAYWTALKGSRQVPARLEIDPRGIEGALSSVFLLERIAPGIARIRLAGHDLNDLMGMEVRGMPFSSFMAPQTRARFADYLEQVFTAPAKLVADLSAERALGKPKCEARLLILPLTDTENRITRALGCLSVHGKIGRAPRRFTMTSQQLRPLDGAVPLPRAAKQEQRVYSFAETPQPFDRPDQRRAQGMHDQPYLRLVKTDD